MDGDDSAEGAPAADDVRWLTEDEQASWRGYVSGATALHDELERSLLASHDLSMDDYAILVLLSETPGQSMRMSAIADAAIVPRPQVTYRVNRLEARGIVERRPAPDDARGKIACLTPQGLTLLTLAARTHVTNVRERFLDHLTDDEFEVLGRAMARVHRALLDADTPQRA